jgi:hypothetical protein
VRGSVPGLPPSALRYDDCPCLQFLAHNCDPPPQHTKTSREELFCFFRTMNVMRRMEIASDLLYKQGHIRGFCHLYDGQEAVAVGMEAALTFDDPLITAYRGEKKKEHRRWASYHQICSEMKPQKVAAILPKDLP